VDLVAGLCDAFSWDARPRHCGVAGVVLSMIRFLESCVSIDFLSAS